MANHKKAEDDIASSQAFLKVLCKIYECEGEIDAVGKALSEYSDEYGYTDGTIINWREGRRVISKKAADAIISAVEYDYGSKYADILRRVYDQTWLGKKIDYAEVDKQVDKWVDSLKMPKLSIYAPVFDEPLNESPDEDIEEANRKMRIADKKEDIVGKSFSDELPIFDIEEENRKLLKRLRQPSGWRKIGTSTERLKQLLATAFKKP